MAQPWVSTIHSIIKLTLETATLIDLSVDPPLVRIADDLHDPYRYTRERVWPGHGGPRIEHEFGMAVVAVARELAVNAWPKLGLARIAPIVTRAWDRGDDDVSAAILRRCLADVEMAVSTLIERMGARENVAWAVTGGLLTHCRVYREGIVGALHDIGRASTVEVLPDVAERVLTLVENGDRDFVGSCVMYP